MILQNISILNYKNIEQAELDFSPKINCIVGHNGEGKTNLLDAVYYLSFCKSSCNPNDSQVIKHDADFMMLEGSYETDDHTNETIYCGYKRHHRKVFKRNNKEYDKLSAHIGNIPLVLVAPTDTELIQSGSDERRRFMDLVISQYDSEYLYQVICYRKAVQQRNILLRAEVQPDDDLISVYENEMARSGQIIYDKRRTFIIEFLPIFGQIYDELSGEKESVQLSYKSHCQEGTLDELILKNRPRDFILGYSSCGVHRDELNMLLNGFPIKREGSQGQNKTYLIALKLAQFHFLKTKGKQKTPILLLDDIFDKLDASRVEKIVHMVSTDEFGQIFITDTNRDYLKEILNRTGKDYRLFSVECGQIKPL